MSIIFMSSEDEDPNFFSCYSENSQESVTDLTRDFKAFRQATESQLEELKKFKVQAETDVHGLKLELNRCTNDIKNLRKLTEELREELQNSKQTIEVQSKELIEFRDSNDHEKRVDNTKRSRFGKIKGIFKKKKHYDFTEQTSPETKIKEKDASFQFSAVDADLKIKEIGTRRHDSDGASQNRVDTFFQFPAVNADKKEEEIYTGRRRSDRESQVSFDASFQFSAVDADIKVKEIGTRRHDSDGASQNRVEIAFPVHRASSLIQVRFNSQFEPVTDELKGMPPYRRRCVSRKSKSFSEQDLDEVFESLQIDIHPAFQEQKEGANVKFECMVQGKKQVSYQWFKDGTKMAKEKGFTLALDSVKLCDFGCYSCEVTAYAHTIRTRMTSAMLEITPRDGMRYKYLRELDPYSEEEVGYLLNYRKFGLGGWKQIAFKYNMKTFHRDHLESISEAGKETMSFLKATNPDLTVYEFCKTLKEDYMRRFDIVKELLDHLAVSETFPR